MKAVVLAVLFFNFFVANVFVSEKLVVAQSSCEITLQNDYANQSGFNDFGFLEVDDDDDLILETNLDSEVLKTKSPFCQVGFALKHYLSGLYRPPSLVI